MRYVFAVLIFSVLIALTLGCGKSSNPTSSKNAINHDLDQWDHKTGFIIKKENKKVLVVKYISKEDLQSKTTDEILLISKPNAIWLTVSNEDSYASLKKGDKVNFIIQGSTSDMYPGEASATNIEVIP